MFCFGVGVKDSPSFKISISSWVSGTFDKFKIFVNCGCVVGGSCDRRVRLFLPYYFEKVDNLLNNRLKEYGFSSIFQCIHQLCLFSARKGK